jgi:protein-lysine N-methyltransferase EEF2KMT
MRAAQMDQSKVLSTQKSSELEVFRREVLQLVPFKSLQWPESRQLKSISVQEWLFDSLFDPEKVPHMAPPRYRIQILKSLLIRIESESTDTEEDVGDFRGSALRLT